GNTPGVFRLLFAHQFVLGPLSRIPKISLSFTLAPFFYQDKARTFLVIPAEGLLPTFEKIANKVDPGLLLGIDEGLPKGPFLFEKQHFLFEMFYHPYVCEFINQFNRYGVDGLLDPGSYGEESWPPRQLISHDFFAASYEPDLV